MHDFRFIRGHLFCEAVRISRVADAVGTPFYVYSHKTLTSHFRKLQQAFRPVSPLICYSVKANANSAILRCLVKMGAGLDIVSGGELFKAVRAGCRPERIVYASVGKTEGEIREAIRRGILFFNVESIPEMELINRLAAGLRKKVQVAIRINPDVEPHTHKFITTGKLTNKFGIDLATARRIFAQRQRFPNLKINGLHIHIGSQIIESGPFVSAVSRVASLVEELGLRGVELEYLNIGGGLGIIYKNERPQTAAQFAAAVLPILKRTGLKIILEPGRFIVGNAGALITRVTYVKKTKTKTFVIVDAGMNDLIRPALYDAYHEVLPLKSPGHPFDSAQGKQVTRSPVDVVGPICESADFFAKNRRMAPLREGDLLAIMGAGAYGFSMSSNYNQRLRPAEIMVVRDKFYTTRRRETYAELLRGEMIPRVLR